MCEVLISSFSSEKMTWMKWMKKWEVAWNGKVYFYCTTINLVLCRAWKSDMRDKSINYPAYSLRCLLGLDILTELHWKAQHRQNFIIYLTEPGMFTFQSTRGNLVFETPRTFEGIKWWTMKNFCPSLVWSTNNCTIKIYYSYSFKRRIEK